MCSELCAKVVLIAFNVVFLIAGLGILGIGVIVRFSNTEYDDLIGSSMLPMATYFMMGAGLIVVFVSLAGCVGAITKNRKILITYMIFLVLVFLVEAAAGILGFMYYGKVGNILDEHVKPAILNKYGYEEYTLASNAINYMQKELECCGFKEPEDWSLSDYYTDTNATIVTDRGATVMPISCCRDVNVVGCNNAFNIVNTYEEGCVLKLQPLIKDNLMMLGVVCVGIALVQLIGVVLSILLCRKSAEEEMDL